MSQYKAVLFDLDGTLTYTLEDLWLSVNYALGGMNMPERTLEEVRQFVGNGVEVLMRQAVPEGTTEEAFFRCFSRFKAHYVEHCQDHTRLYDGILPLMDALKERGVKMAIVSNKLQAGVDELYQQYFSQYMAVAIGEREGVGRKPAPDMALLAMRELGMQPEDCLYVGDSEVDVATARTAGLDCLAVLWGFRSREALEQAGATRFAQRPEEVLQFFRD